MRLIVDQQADRPIRVEATTEREVSLLVTT